MKLFWNKNRAEKCCTFGAMSAETIDTMASKIDALEKKLAGVMAAKTTDAGKSLLIGSDGNVKLSS